MWRFNLGTRSGRQKKDELLDIDASTGESLRGMKIDNGGEEGPTRGEISTDFEQERLPRKRDEVASVPTFTFNQERLSRKIKRDEGVSMPTVAVKQERQPRRRNNEGLVPTKFGPVRLPRRRDKVIYEEFTRSNSRVVFSANGENLFGSCSAGVQAEVYGCKRMGTTLLKAEYITCLAVSKDGRYIGAGTGLGEVYVWNAETHETVLKHKQDGDDTTAVDFSPNSTELVVARLSGTATLWNLASKEIPETLHHSEGALQSAKYSPLGDRVATATDDSVRVWDSNEGCLLVVIPVRVTAWYNQGLLWFDDDLFVVSANTIKKFGAHTGSVTSEWRVPDCRTITCIALPQHREFIACSANNIVTLWDTSTHIQLGRVPHPQEIGSIVFSPDDRFLAVHGTSGKITVKHLSRIIAPVIQIDDATLDSWKHNQLEGTKSLLNSSVSMSQNPIHYVLACRALVGARLRQWDAALADAEMAIDIQPSVFAYIAKSMVHVGNAEKDKAYRTCDIAFKCLQPSHTSFFLLIKAIVVFIAGEHQDAISRVDDLIDSVSFNTICYQAYMYLLLGEFQMDSRDYDGAIRSFERAGTQVQDCGTDPLLVISLIFGWTFENLHVTVQQRLCEVLYTVGRVEDARETLLKMVNTFSKEVYMSGYITKWVSNFTRQCLLTPENVTPRDDPRTLDITPTPLLREWAKATLASGEWMDALVASANFTFPRVIGYWIICERLETIGRISEAIQCFHEMTNELDEDVYIGGPISGWVCDFTQRRLSAPESVGNVVSNNVQPNEMLSPLPTPDTQGFAPLLSVWAITKLANCSWEDALVSAAGFVVPRFTTYRVIYERLQVVNRVTDANHCFRRMVDDMIEQADMHDAQVDWVLGKLDYLGETAMNAGRHDDAISHYSAALALNAAAPRFLIKRSKAYTADGLWEAALNDADKAIELDPLSPWGYERKHAALHEGGDYANAINAFESMLSRMLQSVDPEIRDQHCQYISPEETKLAIRRAVQDAIRDSPRVLINTISGRLFDKPDQATLFESTPVFNKLISSMTTDINQSSIEHDVTQYYRYVMFSHKWEDNEPLFEEVLRTVVYDLEQSPTHYKLQMFCKIVRDDGLHWAWSDTCCINKADHFVLQEALVSMFKWYQGSAKTLVLLRGIPSPSRRGDLVRSIWNSRAWTFQEYHASKVVRFYNEDWTLYRDFDVPNHKESSEIISEMEEATGVSAQALMGLQPGLDDIREKLCLASTRQTTLVEDAAYSLLGIFSMSLPIVYGEGDQALGRLLAQLLASSGDTSILAWSGKPGGFNSCLPANIIVFKEMPSSHIPLSITSTESETTITRLRVSVDLTSATKLYDHLDELPVPLFVGKRMKLPCLVFKLGPVSAMRSMSGRVFRAQTTGLGVVEIKSEEDISRHKLLYLVHPWIDFLLDRQPVGSMLETIPEDADDQSSTIAQLAPESHFELSFGKAAECADTASLQPPSILEQRDKQTLALRLLARLGQPFGALLLTPRPGSVAAYRRVASENLITVQIKEITQITLEKLVDSVRVLDVL